jgi:hypothetical protein
MAERGGLVELGAVLLKTNGQPLKGLEKKECLER